MNYKKVSIIAIGVAGALGATNVWYINKTRKIVDGINNISDNVNLDIPDKIVISAMTKASDKQASIQAERISNIASETINREVDKEITKIKNNLEESVKNAMEAQISVLDIEDIKSAAINKVSKTVIGSSTLLSGFSNPRNEKAEIIRACSEAGITNAIDIRRILEED